MAEVLPQQPVSKPMRLANNAWKTLRGFPPTTAAGAIAASLGNSSVFRRGLEAIKMRFLIMASALVLLSGCMKVSDMAEGTRHQLRDVGILDHSEIRRANSW